MIETNRFMIQAIEKTNQLNNNSKKPFVVDAESKNLNLSVQLGKEFGAYLNEETLKLNAFNSNEEERRKRK